MAKKIKIRVLGIKPQSDREEQTHGQKIFVSGSAARGDSGSLRQPGTSVGAG